MGETIAKALLVVGGISLALLLISFVYSAYTSQADNAQLAISKTNEMNNSLMESEYTQYDAVTVSGSEVVNVIKKHAKDELYICVVIGSNTTYYNRDASLNEVSTSAIDAKKKSAANYINPSSMFIGEVERDSNTDAIIGITFTKQ